MKKIIYKKFLITSEFKSWSVSGAKSTSKSVSSVMSWSGAVSGAKSKSKSVSGVMSWSGSRSGSGHWSCSKSGS